MQAEPRIRKLTPNVFKTGSSLLLANAGFHGDWTTESKSVTQMLN